MGGPFASASARRLSDGRCGFAGCRRDAGVTSRQHDSPLSARWWPKVFFQEPSIYLHRVLLGGASWPGRGRCSNVSSRSRLPWAHADNAIASESWMMSLATLGATKLADSPKSIAPASPNHPAAPGARCWPSSNERSADSNDSPASLKPIAPASSNHPAVPDARCQLEALAPAIATPPARTR